MASVENTENDTPVRPGNETRLAVVGDVHDQWSDEDVVALGALRPDLTIFVGDLGNEEVELVREISQAPFDKAVLLGNHDAFFTRTPQWRVFPCGAPPEVEGDIDPVNEQLDILGDDHIGFSSKAVPGKPVTIVGARPFSSGGNKYKSQRRFLTRLYGLRSMKEYVKKITSVIMDAPQEHSLVVVGHNGPTALGSRREDICGKDFKRNGPGEGDWGDEDLRIVLDNVEEEGRSPKLVVFGHMHDQLKGVDVKRALKTYMGLLKVDLAELRCSVNDFVGIIAAGGGTRKRVVFERNPDILYLNTAVVPRVISSKNSNGVNIHHFCSVRIVDGVVVEASDVWVRVDEGEPVVEREDLLFKRENVSGEDESTPMVFNTHRAEWEEVHPANDVMMLEFD